MAPSFQDSGRYSSVHQSPHGPGDERPTALQIIQDEDLFGRWKDKVILVTGGSNGIGVEIVRALAGTGATVVFTSRNMAKGETVRENIVREWAGKGVEAHVEVLHIDLESLKSVKKAAEDFKKKYEKLNILINNAGVGMTPLKRTRDGFEWQFGVNHLAHFYLFLLLKPLLLSSSTPHFSSRVTVVSSLVHTLGSARVDDYNFEKTDYDPYLGYASSKTCTIWMSNELDRRYGTHGLHSISVHPGGFESGFQANHEEVTGKELKAMIQMEHIAKTIKDLEQGAASVVLAAIGKEYEGVGGFYMEDCGVSSPVADDAPPGTAGYKPWAYNKEGERQLWADSLKMLNLEDDCEEAVAPK